MITIRIPVDTAYDEANPFKHGSADDIKVYEAEYSDGGSFQQLRSPDGFLAFHQWATDSGTHGVSIVEEKPYGNVVKVAVVGMVCFPEIGIMVPECLFTSMPKEVDRRNPIGDAG